MKQGTKHDDNKLRYDLIPWDSIEEVAKIYTLGAKKYGDRNWETGIKYSRIIGAVFRHFTSWVRGVDLDEETGLSHLAHACWGLLTLIWYQKHRSDFDDRVITKTLID